MLDIDGVDKLCDGPHDAEMIYFIEAVGSDAVTLPSKAFHIEAVEALTATAETGTAGPKVRTLASTPGAGQFTLGSDGVTVTFAAADEVLTAKALYVPVPAYLAALAVDEPDLP